MKLRITHILKAVLVLLIVLLLSPLVSAEPATTETSGSIDWFELVIIFGYLAGVFLLLPIVVYTNINETLDEDEEETSQELAYSGSLSEAERNEQTEVILQSIEERLTPFTADDGSEMLTITKGSQAKFMKKALDYIHTDLLPTDPDLIERYNEMSYVYSDRAKRVFTGSWWIILCSIGIGVLMIMTAGFTNFIIIHTLGVVFYVLSSRSTMYGIEKRMKIFGMMPGFLSGVISGLFLGGGTKYYVKSGSGPWKRDWETEGSMAMVGLLIMFVVAMFLGFLAAFLGVINFIINYSSSFLLPFQSNEKWYQKNFVLQ